MKRLLLIFLTAALLFLWAPLADTAHAATCSLNIYPQPTPGTHSYTVTLTNPTSTPAYGFINNYWVDGQPSGNPGNAITSSYNYWSMGIGLGYSVVGWAGIPFANNSITYETDLTVGNSFEGVDIAMLDKNGNTLDICSQGHDAYAITYNNLGVVIPPPAVSNLPPPTPANCSLNIYPQPTPGKNRYIVTLTNNTSTPGYKFVNNFWSDGSPTGSPSNVVTDTDWYIHSPLVFLPYQVTGTAGTPIDHNSITYVTDLTIGNIFEGVDIALMSEGSAAYDICSQGHNTYTVTYNAPLAVNQIVVSNSTIQVNNSITATGSFTDQNVTNMHTAIWNWGDGNTSTGVVTESNGSGSVSGVHTYTAAGVYTVDLTVTDSGGKTGIASYQYVVVYDQSAGWVSGGKQFNSPPGAVTGNFGVTGNVDFGFQAKYANGSMVPSGKNISFSFPAGNINFSSSAYQWMVVNGSKAIFKATGTLNGVTGYTMLVSAIDQSATHDNGLIRFQLKDLSNNIIYDTQQGELDTVNPITPISKGKINVH